MCMYVRILMFMKFLGVEKTLGLGPSKIIHQNVNKQELNNNFTNKHTQDDYDVPDVPENKLLGRRFHTATIEKMDK